MRSLIAILVGALAVALLRGQMYSGALRPHESRPAVLDTAITLVSVALIAFLLGVVVKRRGWLAAAFSFVIGVGIWVIVELRPSPPWVPTDVGGTWESVALLSVIGGLWSALFGAAGSFAAGAMARASARRTGASQ